MPHSNRLAASEPRWPDSREELANARSVLLIEASEARSLLNPRPGVQTVVITHRRLLSANMLATVRPDVIVAPADRPTMGSGGTQRRIEGILAIAARSTP
jgi:hypothetical protein